MKGDFTMSGYFKDSDATTDAYFGEYLRPAISEYSTPTAT